MPTRAKEGRGNGRVRRSRDRHAGSVQSCGTRTYLGAVSLAREPSPCGFRITRTVCGRTTSQPGWLEDRGLGKMVKAEWKLEESEQKRRPWAVSRYVDQ